METLRTREKQKEDRLWTTLEGLGITRDDITPGQKNSQPLSRILEIADLLLQGKFPKDIAPQFNLAATTIHHIRNTRFSSRLQSLIYRRQREVQASTRQNESKRAKS